MKDVREQIESDRKVAAQSTWGACGCGFNHVPGCKVRKTEWILKGAIALVIISAICHWVG